MAYDSIDLQTGVPVASANTPFFGYFPKTTYDINNVRKAPAGPHETITDIFFRVAFIKKVINNISSYYVYDVQDGETPEILAERVYGDRGAGWVILYANNITDGQFEWPLPYEAFNKMIIDRYGSVEDAQSVIHHTEMTITRTNQYGDSHSDTYIIDESDLPGIENTQSYTLGNLIITETKTGQQISNYDWELKENDKRRSIKIIKAEYYAQIQTEFKNLSGFDQSYLRRVG